MRSEITFKGPPHFPKWSWVTRMASPKIRGISVHFKHTKGYTNFKFLFFGASPATALSHDRFKAALPGCTSIHENILFRECTRKHFGKVSVHQKNTKQTEKMLHQQTAHLEPAQRPTFVPFSSGLACWQTLKRSKLSRRQGYPQNADGVKSFLQGTALCTIQRTHNMHK